MSQDMSVHGAVPINSNPVTRFFENLQSAFLDEFEKDVANLSITLKKRPTQFEISSGNDGADEIILAFGKDTTPRQITYSWPGKSPHEAWRFSCILRVLSLIFEAVQDNLLISKRSIYYDNPDLFGSQTVVDSIVDDISYTIGVNRASLHVISVGKGLIAGAARITTKAQSLFDISAGDVLIPRLADIKSLDLSEIKWIIIVEKEAANKQQAVFRRLVHNRFYMTSTAGKGILLTGKGYPDICSREFVHLLSDIVVRNQSSIIPDINITSPSQKPRFFALVDGDPDGLAIMSTYKYGSMAHAHESARLNVPSLEWLGTRISDVIAEMTKFENDDWMSMLLSRRDTKKIQTLLSNNPVFAEDGPQPDWRAGLQIMMMLNIKVETEVLYEASGSLERWIDSKMMSL
ncbi:putative meiosis-specific topoisomerase Spo11 [Talaromyces proteolyticus]|uniref:DNA topoisomerase (ATP-hydrolyzing) n=1 Tax=Talaromyces proteolyticus TaxID=1131652 RepID=A0AAD4KW29_9EURO|nr:putative meiosis-specific topoisomerase Spo11 [Talaromyces proteolyticus]KAH8702282.1 putative meiosis-specific topoisomerase Spo11 [Talaromyces proteolyticus]